MARFLLTVEASVDLTAGADPLLEILVNGIVVSSATITAQTGVGSDILAFTLDFDDSSNTYPSSLQFRYSGSSGNGDEIVTVESVRINGHAINTATDLTATMIARGQTASLSSPSSHDHLFGRDDPLASDLGTATQTGDGTDEIIIGQTATQDIIDAGAGNDRVEGRDDDDAINGGDGNDLLYGQAGNDIILGGNGSDRIWGDNGGDTGDDLLYGQAGDDFLFGEDGNDVLSGGDGNDVLNAGNGDDILYGGDGNDRLIGRSGTNYMYGDAGDDILAGGNGDDTMYGGDDNDTMHGALGNDVIYGDAGQDFITGGNGTDTIDGGDDNDVIYGDADNDDIRGGAGDDEIYGGTGNDTIEGNAGVDTIDGDAGDDTIDGGAGDDVIDGGDDNDTINGGSGADVLTGGAGNDTINGAGITNDVNVFFPSTANLTSYSGGQDGAGSLQIIENGNGFVLDGNLWKRIIFNYTVTSNTVLEFDFKSTWEPEITAIGFETDDNYANDSNRFKLHGDQTTGMNYAAPQATFAYDDSGDWMHYTIDVGTYFTGSFSYLAFVMDDDGGGVDGNAWFRNLQVYDVGNNDDGVNTIYGGDGDDTIYAGSQGDTIYGGNDDDTIVGDVGNDMLVGEDGNDTISGGDGDDTIYAGGTFITPLQDQIDAILAANPGVQYYDENTGDNVVGNFYLHVTTNMTWSAALTNAQSSLINGVAGHLAVITSAAENSFVAGLSGAGDRWIGGSDSAVEGEWRWLGGPDDGQMFWLGAAAGSAQNGYYENWNGGEPNDSGGAEDAIEMNNGGGWNDQGGGASQDSVIEWEGSLLLTLPDEDLGTVNNIDGGDGVDTIYGAGGIDIINGGNGNDYIDGGDANDQINGGGNNDEIYGGGGDDIINGGANSDELYGEEGDDTIDGSSGSDLLEGGLGDDILYGGSGDDTVSGDYAFGFVSTQQGWSYDYYDFTAGLTNLASAGFTINGGMDNTNTPTSSGMTSDLDPALIDAGDQYAIRYETVLTITTAGTYTFRTASDDGSQLFLDGSLIVNNDGLHGTATVTSAGQALTAGTYMLVATFFENGGGNVMQVTMSGPDTGSVYTDLGPYAGVNTSNITGPFGDDILYGGDGFDVLFGGGGADTFVFESASAFNDVDQIREFNQSEGDALDISDILSGLGVNAGNVAQYVQVTSGNGLRVDVTGSSNFGASQQIASFSDTTDVSDALTMFGNGNLIV